MIGLTRHHNSDRIRKEDEEFDRRVIRAASIRILEDDQALAWICSDGFRHRQLNRLLWKG